MYTTTNATGGVNDLSVSGQGRYVRMYGTARGTAWGYSLWEFEVYGTPTTVTIPAAPSNLVATSVSSSQINISFADNSNNETGFELQRSANGTTWSALATLAANTTSYSNTGLTASTIYYYRVRSTNSAGQSAWSNTANATTQGNTGTAPVAPSGLVASSISASQINLSFTDNSNNETLFRIQRSTDGSNFADLTTVGANVATYQNTGLAANTTYYYRVRAENFYGVSAYSNTANAKTSSGTGTICDGVAAYSSTKVYNAGDKVVYNGKLYQALANGLANVPPDYCPSCGWFKLLGDCTTAKSAIDVSDATLNDEMNVFPNPVLDVKHYC
jgi:phosphodiesterase/alkaline phosphatase D-like protein